VLTTDSLQPAEEAPEEPSPAIPTNEAEEEIA
jgi:hypothetical protein